MNSGNLTQLPVIVLISAYLEPRLNEIERLFAQGYPSDAVFHLRKIKGFIYELRVFYSNFCPDVLELLSNIDAYLFDIIYRASPIVDSIFRSAAVFVWCQALGKTPFYFRDIQRPIYSLRVLIRETVDGGNNK